MAETLINKNQAGEGIYTQDNLIAGTNISITQVPQRVIDANTVELLHFNDNTIDAISNTDVYSSGTVSYATSMDGFGKCLFNDTTNVIKFSIPQNISSSTTSFTVDFWMKSDTFFWGSGIRFGSSDPYRLYFSSDTALKIETNLSGGSGVKTITVDSISGLWTHIAYVHSQVTNTDYIFVNGVLKSSWTRIYQDTDLGFGGVLAKTYIDELRVSNVARWTSDFTPYSVPYSASVGPTQYAINNTKADPDLSSYLQNKATGTDSLTIEGNSTANSKTVNIGKGTTDNGGYASILGYGASSYSSGVAVGYSASAGPSCVSIGPSASTSASGYNVAIGSSAAASNTVGVAIGNNAKASGGYATAIGSGTSSSVSTQATASNSIALGYNAKSTAQNAIQIGNGTNSTANTAQIKGTQILNASGKIPKASIEEITILVEDYTE